MVFYHQYLQLETEIREEICALIHSGSCSTHMEISPTDFKFINMSGKQASVACCKDNFGCAVKELGGSGSVYVRLTKCTDFEGTPENTEYGITE